MVIQFDLTFGLGLLYQKKHPNNNKIYHLTPYNILIISEIDNIQYKIIISLSTHSIRKYLPEDQHTVHYQIDAYSLKSSCVCVLQNLAHVYL